MRRLLLPAVLVFAAVAPPAQAASVSSTASSVYYPGGKGFPDMTVTTRQIAVAAAPGEANVVSVSGGGGVVVVRDAGAPLVAGPGCDAAPEGAVACPVAGASVVVLGASLGDGDDRLEIAPGVGKATVDGGPGDDVVVAPGGGELTGGEGDDVLGVGAEATLRGGPGADTLTGSPSFDTLDGGPGTDALDGGAGVDQLSYAGRTDGVVVDLAAPTAGAPGEEDRIAGFENAAGGEGPDVLRAGGVGGAQLRGAGGDDVIEGGAGGDGLDGGDGADRLAGGAGDDQLDGGYGDDALDGGAGKDSIVARAGADVAEGGPGNDEISDLADDGGRGDVFRGGEGDDLVVGATVEGGPGDDELYGSVLRGGPGDDRLDGPRSAAAARTVDCGPGRDTLLRPADRVLVPRGCERVEPWFFGGRTVRVPPLVDGRRVTVWMPNGCLYASVGARCRVKAALFVGGRHVGTEQARWRRERDGARALRWTLPRRVRRGAVMWLRLVKYETDETTERGGYSVRLR